MSTETKFTPGPWRASLDDFGDYAIQPAGQELAVAAVVNGDARGLLGEASEHAANAHLIAAAPEMYEALQAIDWSAVLLWRDRGDEVVSEEAIKAVRAALAKAEGRQP